MKITRKDYEDAFIQFAYALGFNCTPFYYPYTANTLKYLKSNDLFGYDWGYPDWIGAINSLGQNTTGTAVWKFGPYNKKSEKLRYIAIKRLINDPIRFRQWFMPYYNVNYYNEKGEFDSEKARKLSAYSMKEYAKNHDVLLSTVDNERPMKLFDNYNRYKNIKEYWKTIKVHHDYLFIKKYQLDIDRYAGCTLNIHAPIIRLVCENDFDGKFPKKLLTFINRVLHKNYDQSLFLYTEYNLRGQSIVYMYVDREYSRDERVIMCKLLAQKLKMNVRVDEYIRNKMPHKQFNAMLPLSNMVFGERTKQARYDLMLSVVAKAIRIAKDVKQAELDGQVLPMMKFIEDMPKLGLLNLPEVKNIAKMNLDGEVFKDVESVAKFCRMKGWVVTPGRRVENQVKIVTAGVLRGFSESQCEELLNSCWDGSSDYPHGLPASLFHQLYAYCAARNSGNVVQRTTKSGEIVYSEETYGDQFLSDFRSKYKHKSHFFPDIIRLLNEKLNSVNKHNLVAFMLKKNPANIRKLFKAVNEQLIENVFYNIYNERKNNYQAKDFKDLNRKIYFSFTIFKKVCMSLDFMEGMQDNTLKQYYYIVKDVLMKYYNLIPLKVSDRYTYIASKICEQFTNQYIDNDVFSAKMIEMCNKLGSRDANKIMRRFKEWIRANDINITTKESLDILFESFIVECKKSGSEFAKPDVLEVLKAHKMGGIRDKDRYYRVARRRLQLQRIINT